MVSNLFGSLYYFRRPVVLEIFGLSFTCYIDKFSQRSFHNQRYPFQGYRETLWGLGQKAKLGPLENVDGLKMMDLPFPTIFRKCWSTTPSRLSENMGNAPFSIIFHYHNLFWGPSKVRACGNLSPCPISTGMVNSNANVKWQDFCL